MSSQATDIRRWEAVEVERSAAEAKRKGAADLRIRAEVVTRYANPLEATCFPLEYAYHLLGNVRGKTVLDYGCGLGDNSVLIASRAARVVGLDISPELVGLARARLEQHGLERHAHLHVGSAHQMPFPDASIDVVFGMAILHHLDLGLASAEIFRVLKPGGRAIFMEPVRNSRLLKWARKLIPYRHPDVSPFERPLTDAEIAQFSERFGRRHARAFCLPFVSLVEVLGLPENVVHAAYRIDGRILKAAPMLQHYAGVRVIEITK